MAHIARKVTVAAPVQEVYDAWARFPELADALPSVKRIDRLDDRHLRWHVAVGGRDTSFDAEIVERVPGALIAWRSTDGPTHAGAVAFRGIADALTEIEVTMDVPAEELALTDAVVEERLGASVAKNLRRFKRRLEPDRRTDGRRDADARAGRVALGGTAGLALGWGAHALLTPHRSRWPWRRWRTDRRRRIAAGVLVLLSAAALVAATSARWKVGAR